MSKQARDYAILYHITVLFADLTCARARVSSCACAHFPISLKWR